jgi:hypothetical protein
VAELVGQVLDLISREAIVIPETSVVGWSGCSLNSLVGAEVEVILCGVGDVGIHRCASRDVPRPAGLVPVVRTEQSGVVALLHHDEGDAGPVVLLQVHAGLPDGQQLKLQNCVELSFRDPISVHHDPVWLEPSLLVEVNQGVLDHAGESADDILPCLLYADHSTVG